MTSRVPWQVEARETAREAARRSGVSIVDWINSVLNEPARPPKRDEAERPPPAAPPRSLRDDEHGRGVEALAEMRGRFDELGRQLDRLSRQNTEAAYTSPPARETDDLADLMDRLDRRLDQLFAIVHPDRSVEAPSDTDRPSAAAVATPANPPEQASHEIAERQHALDSTGGASMSRSPRADVLPRPPTQTLAGLEQLLRRVTSQIENVPPRGIEKALDTLRDDLAGIGLTLKEAMPRQAIESLENEVRTLSARLELAPQTDRTDAGFASVERSLADIRDALRALTPAENLAGIEETVRDLARRIDHIGANSPDTGALQQIEGAIAGLRDVASQVVSNGALTRLSEEVAALAAKIDQIASSNNTADLLSTLEQRIASIADALDHRTQIAPTVPHDLDTIVQGLADKLEQIGFARSGPAGVGQVEDRIATLVAKLDSSSSRLDQIESVERGLSDLVASLERRQTEASRAEPSPEVSSLRQDMQQTRSSLDTVQGALGSLLERLAAMENDARAASAPPAGGTAAAAAAMHEASPAGKSAAAPVPAPPSPAAEQPARAVPGAPQAAIPALAGAEPSAPERRPVDPSLPPDQPIEPGAMRARNGNSPGQRIAASEAALGSAKPPVVPDQDGKSNFIAAARRAAQAASTGARSEKSGPAAVAPATEAKAASRWGSRVRQVLVAISVVIIVLGSLHMVVNLLSGPGEPDSPPAVDSRTLPENGSAVVPETPAGNDPASPAAPAVPGRQSLFDNAGGTGARLAGPPPAGPTQPAAVEPIQSPIAVAPEEDVTNSLGRPLASMPASPPTKPAPTAARPSNLDRLPAAFSSTLRAAAAKGDAGAEYEIAQRYADGRGVPQNLAEAADWFDRAAKQGLVLAQFRLGGLYEKGWGVRKDLEAARRLYTSAAEAGNAKAMHNLAVLYVEGIGGKTDYATAAKWFRQAADCGLADSQYNLGILYARGLGVETNPAEAYKWFALAARAGDKEAASKRDDVAGRLDPRLLAAAKLELESWSALDQPEAATQAFVPSGGWDPVIPTPPSNPKPRAGAVKGETSQAAR